MECYFFHMATRDQRLIDHVGKHLSSLGEAHEHALRLIEKTTKYVDTPCHERWMIEVCSPPDRVMLVVLFPLRDHLPGSWTFLTRHRQRRDTFGF